MRSKELFSVASKIMQTCPDFNGLCCAFVGILWAILEAAAIIIGRENLTWVGAYSLRLYDSELYSHYGTSYMILYCIT